MSTKTPDPLAPLEPLTPLPPAGGGAPPPPPPAPDSSAASAAAPAKTSLPRAGENVTFHALVNGPAVRPFTARVRRVVDAKKGTLDLDVSFPAADGGVNLRTVTSVLPMVRGDEFGCWSLPEKPAVKS